MSKLIEDESLQPLLLPDSPSENGAQWGGRAEPETLVEKGQHQTVARRMVAWPPASSSTASAATTPVRPRADRPAEDPPAVDQRCQCSKLTTTATATTTSACAA